VGFFQKPEATCLVAALGSPRVVTVKDLQRPSGGGSHTDQGFAALAAAFESVSGHPFKPQPSGKILGETAAMSRSALCAAHVHIGSMAG